MASTYSSSELKGSGINLKENLTATTTYTFSITSSSTGQSYLFIRNKLHDATLPAYFEGSTIDNLSDTVGQIIESYKIGIGSFKDPNSSFDFTPIVNITGNDVVISATGDISVSII